MSKSCCASAKQRMILACSGGSNVGQATNQAAVELTREGYGKMFCLVGIGAGLQGFVQSARDAEEMIVLDGCPVGCAKAILDREGIVPKVYLVATALGLEKTKDPQLLVRDEEVRRIKDAVHADEAMEGPALAGAAPGLCGCSGAQGA